MLRVETSISRDRYDVVERIKIKRRKVNYLQPPNYIPKEIILSLSVHETARMKELYTESLISQKKLFLVLDLDHTLLHSIRFSNMQPEEKNKIDLLEESVSKGELLFKLDEIAMMTKLRPFVRDFLEEASKLFLMYIHTKGSRPYADEMARLLDPKGVYFASRIIAREDSTDKTKKDLDLVLGQESAILIVDDTEKVWRDHKENLVLVNRYDYFSSSATKLGGNELESDGTLASVLEVLKEIHARFLNGPEDGDVRKELEIVRKGVLEGCN